MIKILDGNNVFFKEFQRYLFLENTLLSFQVKKFISKSNRVAPKSFCV